MVSINRSNLVECANIGAEPSVNAQYFFVNESSQAKAVKALDTVPPDTGVSVFSQTLVVKAVDLRDLSRLKCNMETRKIIRFHNRIAAEIYYYFVVLTSWFPLSNVMCAGYLSLRHSSKLSVSTELCPRSTKSPKKI